VQLNALFYCLWRNIESSCHKHFIIFSHNQHRRLLPAMCHNLQDGGRRPPATLLTAPGRITISAYPPALDTPVRGVPVGILPCRLTWKN